jgi:hypothetical protein
MTTQRVLNPRLYAALKQRFGHVEVANQGEAMMYQRHRSHSGGTRGRMRTTINHSGEYYRINCPFCADTRRRLWVNHRYLTLLEGTNERMTWVLRCFNEDCLSQFSNQEDFRLRLQAYANVADRSNVVVEPAVQTEAGPLQPTTFPGSVVPLTSLPQDHPAIRYLAGERRFDIRYLEQQFNVCYCTQVDSSRFNLAKDRVIIPAYMHGQLVGWQARAVGEYDWHEVPKYWGMPHMPKKRMLYNWDVAQHSRTLVVLEGAPAVWAMGSWAVALFGKTMSHFQLLLIQEWILRQGAGAGVVLMLDRNAQDQMDGIYPDLQRVTSNRACRVLLPDDRDPADLEFSFTVRLIREQSLAQGITLELPT